MVCGVLSQRATTGDIRCKCKVPEMPLVKFAMQNKRRKHCVIAHGIPQHEQTRLLEARKICNVQHDVGGRGL